MIGRGERYPLVRHVTEAEISPRPISVSATCHAVGTCLARPTNRSIHNPGWHGIRGAHAAYPGLWCQNAFGVLIDVPFASCCCCRLVYNNEGVAPGYGENRPSAKPIIFYPEAHPTEARTRSPFGARFRRMNRFLSAVELAFLVMQRFVDLSSDRVPSG